MGGVVTELRLLLLSEFVDAKVEVCPSDDFVTRESVPHFVEGLVTSDFAESNE
jgi:hypothetical protein